MKKTALVFLLASMFFCSSAFAQSKVAVSVDGEVLSDEAFIQNGTTFVPLRKVAEALGAQVMWIEDTSSVEIYSKKSIPDIAQKVGESVVAIAGNYKSEFVSSAAAQYKDTTAHGTGVVIKSGGVILTNAHVVRDIENITVIFRNGESFAGTVLYMDEKSDLAVVKINKLGLTPIELGKKEDIIWGETVIAIGTPLSLSMRNTVTKGIIGGVDVSLAGEYYPVLQTDAAINAGNSGGPLVDMNGRLIGINSSKYSGVGVEGLAFSIPVDTVRYVLKQFEENGRVIRPDIKATLEESWEAKRGLPTYKGITVKSSDNGVLRNGDEIVAVNGIKVHSLIEYNKAIRDTYTGGSLSIMYRRMGNETSTEILAEPEV